MSTISEHQPTEKQVSFATAEMLGILAFRQGIPKKPFRHDSLTRLIDRYQNIAAIELRVRWLVGWEKAQNKFIQQNPGWLAGSQR